MSSTHNPLSRSITPWLILLTLLGLLGTANASAQLLDQENVVPQHYLKWLSEVETLISVAEKKLFLSLSRDYQRDAFIEQFWRVRDPYPRTARNELKERWPVRLAEARSKWRTLRDDRSRMLLTHGEPRFSLPIRCTKTRVPAEVWFYRGTDWLDIDIALVFLKQGSEARLWKPGGSGFGAEQALRSIRSCINGAQLTQVMAIIRSDPTVYLNKLQRLLTKPRPRSIEWVDTFTAFSTDLPDDAEPLAGNLEFSFPGRHQHRTVAQGMVSIAAEDANIGEYADYSSYDFHMTGEILQDGGLFESFRYKFGFPADGAPVTIPLGFQRYLRPGQYQLVLRLDDLNSKRALRVEQDLTVPAVDGQVAVPTFQDPATQALFSEATAAVAAGETGIRLIPPQKGELLSGFTRFDSLVSGDQISKVRFVLDDKPIVTKNRPPYSVQIDLGPYPDLRTLTAIGLDADGGEVSRDELLINAGGYRFLVRLRDPRPGKTYTQSLRARAEVEVPEGRTLDRVELFLNETLVATLFQEPFVHPIVLPSTTDVGYVRAVAYLADGNSTEDIAFINAPDYIEELEVQFVELFTSVLDRQGRPVTDLEQENFTVLEDGVEQKIARFERVQNLPIHVGILIDNSASMTGTLDEVRRAALSFFQQAITEKDRAAVITFNNFPNLAVELTNDRSALGSGLAGLTAEGKTALYDSVMFSLYYFTGIRGQRAILVLSDGKDESSRFEFDQTLEYARRAGITIYTIGLRLGEMGARSKLNRLADETGGRSFFIRDINDLESIYTTIQQELRSQLLIAYQSNNTSDEEEFRRVELKVDRDGLTVKTLSGYYP